MATILMTVFAPSVYGAGRMASHFGLRMLRDGHQLIVAYDCVPRQEEPSILEDLAAAGAMVRHVPNMATELLPMVKGGLSKLIHEIEPDLVVSCQQRDMTYAMAAANKTGVSSLAICMNQPNFGGNFVAKKIKSFLYGRAASKHATHLIAVAPRIRTILKDEFGATPSKVTVVPCGINPREVPAPDDADQEMLRSEFDLSSSDFVCVNLARIHRQKGQDLLIHAIHHLVTTGRWPATGKVLLVGGCEDANAERLLHQLEELVHELDLQSIVRFVGFRDDFRIFLHVSDMFVLPSRWEGLPLVILEAMHAEVPVVITDYGERFEHFRQGTDGLYVENENPVALADGIHQLIAMSPKQRKQMGRSGHDFVNQHLTLDRSLSLFSDLVQGMTSDSQ